MNNRKAQLSIGFVCMVLAFFITWQVKSVYKNSADPTLGVVRADQLQNMLRLEKEKNEALYKQVMEYKDEIAEYQASISQDSNAASILKNDLDKAEFLAGMTEVEGPGLIITLKDSQMANPTSGNENLYVVPDDDVLKVLNELRAAGAEAISVNEERIIATSEIRCAGPTISVNNNRTAAPFVIKAIGDSKQLESALMMRGGVVDTLTQWGIEVELKHKSNMNIAAYKGAVKNNYAKKVVPTATPAPNGTKQ